MTGHNIANATTNGFKESRTEFADLYSTAMTDAASTNSGRGVRVARVAQQFGQGTVEFTSNALDLAVNGEGFFILSDPGGSTYYTRAGAYGVDRDGYVVNHAQQRLQAFPPIDPAGTRFSTGITTDLLLPSSSGAPNATQNITTTLNLDAAQTEPPVPFDLVNPNNITPSMYNHATSTTVYDSLGTSYTVTMYYRKTANPREWNVFTTMTDATTGVTSYMDPPAPAVSPTATLTFDNVGDLDPAASNVTALGVMNMGPYAPANGAAAMNLSFDYALTTQYGGQFSVNDLTQDGYTTGRISGVDIDNTGAVFARYTNGNSEALGKIALAKFNNPQGLRQVGDTNWAANFAAGDVQIGEAITSSFGVIQSRALENSNVDIAEQLVKLITAQHNFQANSQVISTADSVTQTLLNLR